MTTISAAGTAFHGAMFLATVRELTDLLGPADETGDMHGKTTHEWVCTTAAGDVFSVYDYKQPPFGKDQRVVWHIGARSRGASRAAIEELAARMATRDPDDGWNHKMNCPVGCEGADLVLKREEGQCHQQAVERIREWLMPVLVGGLSAGRDGTVHDTADRLAETILIGITNTLAGNTADLFQPQDEFPF